MVQIDFVYDGDLRCVTTHAPSHTELTTDAPVDNCGRGESFSPTDLVATALGTCMLTTMGIFAQRNEIDLRGAKATVRKEMTSSGPRKIARLTCELHLPVPISHPQREALERAALTCPVATSLHPDVAMPVTFAWQ